MNQPQIRRQLCATDGGKYLISQGLRLCLIGLILVAVACLAPNAGGQPDKPLFEVARQSAWSVLGDWPAAWCSVRIVLLSTGALLAAISLWMLLAAGIKHRLLDYVFLPVVAAPLLGCSLGLYYFVKAIL
jgi:hypothetical protein